MNWVCCYCGAGGHSVAGCPWTRQGCREGMGAKAQATHIQIRYQPGDAVVPVGTVVAWNERKNGFLVANGALVSKRLYAELYAAIGGRWSTPEDARIAPDMFRLPDFRLNPEGA